MATVIQHIVSEAVIRARVPGTLKKLVQNDVQKRGKGSSESEIVREILYAHYGLDPVTPWQKDSAETTT